MKIYICVCLVLMALALNTERADGLKQDTGPKFDTIFRRPRRTPIVSPIIRNETGSDPDNDDFFKNQEEEECFDRFKECVSLMRSKELDKYRFECSAELCGHHPERGYNLCRKYCRFCYERGIHRVAIKM